VLFRLFIGISLYFLAVGCEEVIVPVGDEVAEDSEGENSPEDADESGEGDGNESGNSQPVPLLFDVFAMTSEGLYVSDAVEANIHFENCSSGCEPYNIGSGIYELHLTDCILRGAKNFRLLEHTGAYYSWARVDGAPAGSVNYRFEFYSAVGAYGHGRINPYYDFPRTRYDYDDYNELPAAGVNVSGTIIGVAADSCWSFSFDLPEGGTASFSTAGPGDINFDGEMSLSDMAAFESDPYDFNLDGSINDQDHTDLLSFLP
jgi:hypothetical protein